MKLFFTLRNLVVSLLARPTRVLIICLSVIIINLVFRGGLIDILNLNQNLKKLKQQKIEIAQDIKKLDMKIIRASDPHYLELEVLNRFDLAQEGDLIFVFSDNEKN